MKRRPPEPEDDGGLDSLLDTMTNVVGILVLVLIVTQLGVSEKVARITAESDITQQDLEDTQDDLRQQQIQVEELRQQAQAVSEIDMAAERQRLNRLQESLTLRQQEVQQQTEEVNRFALQIETQRQQAETIESESAESERQRRELDTAIQQLLEQRTLLTAMLDKTPRTRAPKKLQLRIPHPRPAPQGATEATFICAHERIFPLRLDYHRQYATEASKQIITALRLNLDPEAGIDPTLFIEPFQKLAAPEDEYFRAEYYVIDQRWPRIRFRPIIDQGSTVTALTRQGTRIRKLISSLNPQQLFCRFHVLPDSYEVYIAARRAVTNQNLMAGWVPQPNDWTLTTSVPEIELGPPRPPPPPPANPPARQRPPNVID